MNVKSSIQKLQLGKRQMVECSQTSEGNQTKFWLGCFEDFCDTSKFFYFKVKICTNILYIYSRTSMAQVLLEHVCLRQG